MDQDKSTKFTEREITHANIRSMMIGWEQGELTMDQLLAAVDAEYDTEIGQLTVERDAWQQATDDVEARYPTDIFPPDGESTDSRSAEMARRTCANIRIEAKRLVAEESPDDAAT